ncbi:hypothetical protein A2872_04285 [Candidatus Gottesmanbacteria bacterium RIFCSPHIGHO2_01_FULL_42_12]|uniref:Uncharacterized protein n=1 Tax=Candidatus Gottesmanbacteria bacterium RIFCSPHIGHO2_01_FULL_42_12 TaxID=1798377 RepID=A0A1F5Z117_9BACT|nr:MAG: hypothetical protein A2872_04285 [Candidatus Gottesmanbacteria bacterium RIFCSPHIGHO2_01_FULL_42_12]
MFTYQLLLILALVIIYCAVIFYFCKRFQDGLSLPLILMFPIIIFSLGFALRLTNNKTIIDVGYFVTDSSSAFISILFTGAIILGQLKYWKK